MASDDLNESLSEVEAVMRLLEEKERDLELAARIGQTLLADNRKLKVKRSHVRIRPTRIRTDRQTGARARTRTRTRTHRPVYLNSNSEYEILLVCRLKWRRWRCKLGRRKRNLVSFSTNFRRKTSF